MGEERRRRVEEECVEVNKGRPKTRTKKMERAVAFQI